MPVHNADIAAVFDEIADLLEIGGENPFRVRAYRNAARSVEAFGRDIGGLLSRGGELPKLSGIGADLGAKVREIAATGSCALLDKLHGRFPATVTELLKVPGLGPKRVKLLYDELAVQTLAQLEQAARKGRIRNLPGVGEKTEQRILRALEVRRGVMKRVLLPVAAQYAEALQAALAGVPGVSRVTVAGSYRRMRETVGDLDLLVCAAASGPALDRLCAYDEVAEVLARGETRASVRLKSGLQVDLRIVAPESCGAALQYFTGSKAHGIALRRIAQERGLKLNEYGLFRGGERIAGETEESVYAALGLPYIEPELREDNGEIEAARAGRLPRLVTLADLQGDLHVHTRASDGHGSVEEMALAAKAAGLRYIAVTDHSRRLTVAHGLDPARLARQIDEIDRVNSRLDGITVLKGVEVDILADGSLDLPDSILERLDLVVGAVHSAFDLPRRRQTDRIVRAMNSACFSVLAHPGGRLIGAREPCDFDMLRVVREARERGCFLELNAHAERLDLTDAHCRMAREEGVLVSVDSDAHSPFDFASLRYGIGQARRGWLTAPDVLNARSLDEIRPLLARTMGRRRK
ncbi:MAG TPA: DNA polymerase/3'-5' exonuclease PolX [Burkholderiales bacterium]|nr:DNA polymerase/3'-5' exonuclease PolX [Burkholderiales bacterium]